MPRAQTRARLLEETTRGLRDPRKHQKGLNHPLGLLLPGAVVPQQRLPLLPPIASSTSLFPTTATTGSSLQDDTEEEEATFGDMTDASLAADGVLVEISVDDELERATTTAVVGGDEANTSSIVDDDVVVVVDNDVMFIKHVPRMRQPTVLTPLTPSTTTIPSLSELTRAGLNEHLSRGRGVS